MKIANVINSIVTEIATYSWTSDSGTGTTTLQEVYSYKNHGNTEGMPFACVYEGGGSGSILTAGQAFQMDNIINIDVCVNWSVMNKTTDDLKRAEAMLRLREAWDYMKTQMFTLDFIDTIGVDMQNLPSYSFVSLDDLNVYLYRITISVKEVLP